MLWDQKLQNLHEDRVKFRVETRTTEIRGKKKTFESNEELFTWN